MPAIKPLPKIIREASRILTKLADNPMDAPAREWLNLNWTLLERAMKKMRRESIPFPWQDAADQALVGAASRARSLVSKLLDMGASPNAGDGAALANASLVGDVEIMRTLIHGGADPNRRGGFILLQAVRIGNVPATDILLQAGADSSARKSEAMGVAAEMGSLILLDRLIDTGADPCARNGEALARTAAAGRVESVKLLLKRGKFTSYQILTAIQGASPGCAKILEAAHMKASPGSIALR